MAVTRRRVPATPDELESERALAIDALRLARLLRQPSRWPARWTEPIFGLAVEGCRRHVADLTTPEELAWAYRHDVFLVPGGADGTDVSPMRVAYALRWLELQQRSTGPSWPAMIR